MTKLTRSRCLKHLEPNFIDILEWPREAAYDEQHLVVVSVTGSSLGPKNLLKVFYRLCSIFNSRNLKKYYLGLKNKDEKIEPNWLFLAFKKTEKSGFSKKCIKNHKTYEISLSEAFRTKLL